LSALGKSLKNTVAAQIGLFYVLTTQEQPFPLRQYYGMWQQGEMTASVIGDCVEK
jgi:hypothetical protein